MSEKIRGAKNAYDVARFALAKIGIHTVDQAYAALPEMPVRTVRRIFEKGAVLMDDGETMSKDSDVPPSAHLDTITAKAKEAGVSLRAAISAVLRFGNPVERVERVLDDLRILKGSRAPARNPSGLFVTAMRTGENVKLPEHVLDKQEAGRTDERPPLRVGEWVKWNLEWMRVMVLSGAQVLLSPTSDILDSYKINLDQILHLPRRPSSA